MIITILIEGDAVHPATATRSFVTGDILDKHVRVDNLSDKSKLALSGKATMSSTALVLMPVAHPRPVAAAA